MRIWKHPKIIVAALGAVGVVISGTLGVLTRPDYVVFRGRITDAGSGAPLQKVKVAIDAKPSGVITYTDDEGRFVFTLPKQQLETDVRVRVTAPGYDPYDRAIHGGGDYPEDIRLQSPLRVPGNATPPAKPTRAASPPIVEVLPRDDTDISNYVRREAIRQGGGTALIVDENGAPDSSFTTLVAQTLGVTDAVFVPEFGPSEAFKAAHAGTAGGFSVLAGLRQVVLGVGSVVSTQEEVAGVSVVRCMARLALRVITPALGGNGAPIVLTGVGVDFERERAIDKARAALAQSLAHTDAIRSPGS